MRIVGLVFSEKESTRAVNEVSADHMATEGHTPECSTRGSTLEQGDEKPLADMTVTELRNFAAARGIDVAGASKKSELLLAVQTAVEPCTAGCEQPQEE